ncbi:fatty acid cis/trans isomerase [uncultured Thiocystis sp.]|jgi:hypothetical protein|uniref:fatty acid cis/trans isomerase n=1 Tax=uncultured Thiocystis sp. TaxID=1202134 RepID=UPI0025D40FAF|nr:fatty acid cis/trans isomerase [uncultured Thiocystis sp.]
MSRRWPAWLLVIFLSGQLVLGCSPSNQPRSNATGPIPPVPIPAAILAGSVPTPDYAREIQPIFNRRCIACHGCLGSPCNLKLDAFEGAARGGFGLNPYAGHLGDVPRTDMDAAESVAEWRTRGFYPVLSEGESPQARLDGSLMYRLLAAGTAHNQPGFSRDALVPVYAHRYAHACPATPAALDAQLQANPARGMPFGLPALAPKDFATLTHWLAAGAPGPTEKARQVAARIAQPAAVARWEAFFNGPDARHRLVSRFIYEHVFLATLVLEESPGERFRLVRSTTPPGQPVRVIGTGLPYDDPYAYAGVTRFWYRLEKLTQPAVQKNLFIWQLRGADIAHLQTLFFGADGGGANWDLKASLDPGWGVGNPFSVFRAIPPEARARFLLENAALIVAGITDGPVCLGQTATYAVKDNFWVFFLDPKADVTVQNPELGLATWDTFMNRSVFGNAAYEKAYGKALARLRPQGWSVDAIWNGDNKNPNAWLTVMRHDTNVSVVKGRQGGTPPTYWLIDYGGLERMYYDTVAGFKYWQGDLGKLQTLLFFNYLRQEFEDNFLLLLPPGQREQVRHAWTQGIGSYGLVLVPFAGKQLPTQVQTNLANPVAGAVQAIAEHLGPTVAGPPDRLNPDVKPAVAPLDPIAGFADWEHAIASLTVVPGQPFTRYLPSVIVLRLKEGNASRVYSLVVNRVYQSQFTLGFQDGQALPNRFSLSVYPTLVNGFPNFFIDLEMNQAGAFLNGLRGVKSLADWEGFKDRWGILRNSERLWPFYDWICDWNVQHRGVAAGSLDLSYYDVPE